MTSAVMVLENIYLAINKFVLVIPIASQLGPNTANPDGCEVNNIFIACCFYSDLMDLVLS
jgi:hypothetical protein